LLSQTTLVLISSAPYLCSSLISSRSHFKASNYYYPKNAATNSCFLQLPEFCLVYLASCRARVTVAYFFWSRVQISTTRHQMALFCLAHFFCSYSHISTPCVHLPHPAAQLYIPTHIWCFFNLAHFITFKKSTWCITPRHKTHAVFITD
jgi:hypothetical protein